MATIRIEDLSVRTIIGTHAWERTNKQELILNIVLDYDGSKAGQSDKLKDALNYEALAIKVVTLVEQSKFFLLEKLAAKILDAIVLDKRVNFVLVRIQKPQALGAAKAVSYEISFQR